VDSKSYTQSWHSGYHQKLKSDIESAASNVDPIICAQANELLSLSGLIVPLEQDLLKRGEMALAYYNLLNDHLKEDLKKARQCDVWTHIYTQLCLPEEKYALYNQVNHYRRAYFVARDCKDSIDTLFEHMLTDVADLVGERVEKPVESNDLRDYLAEHLEFQGAGYTRDFTAHLRYYCKARHKQCCMCSSSSSTTKLMGPEVPANIGVQVFSNRLRGGSGEPKRNVCPICRTQLILEKLIRISFKRGSDQYTNFYLHLYPYAFFTRSYQDAIYFTLKNIVHEESQCFLFRKDNYYKSWSRQHEQILSTQAVRQAQRIEDRNAAQFTPSSTKVNGISVPQFSEATTNTPTLPLNAPGENYAQQFLFALTHALMIADFFGCRVAMSRMPFPLLNNDYMVEHGLAFFVDGVPLNLRWILPTNEYRSLETYRDGQVRDGGVAYVERQKHWQHERLDEQGYTAYENIHQRLSVLYQLSWQLNLSPEDSEDFLLEAAMALADDPLSIYRVVDLAIEKQLKETRSKTNNNKTNKRKPNTNSGGGSNKNGSAQRIAPEQMAIYLSKRVAPFLDELVKE
jgi:CRISPR-associated protein Csc3